MKIDRSPTRPNYKHAMFPFGKLRVVADQADNWWNFAIFDAAYADKLLYKITGDLRSDVAEVTKNVRVSWDGITEIGDEAGSVDVTDLPAQFKEFLNS